jgi:hypothetical protein
MANRTSFTTTYTVTPGNNVSITVVFGNGQFGTSILRVLKRIKIGDLDAFVMGKGSALRGRKATLKSIVTDVNDRTNNVSATYTLRGGPQPLEFTLEGVVDNEGDSERFGVEIAFV